MIHTRGCRVLFGLALVVAASCETREVPARDLMPPVDDPTLLWAPPNARVDSGPPPSPDRSSAISFFLADAEAEDVVSALIEHFRGRGWLQRDVHRANGRPTSFRTGWQIGSAGRGIFEPDADGRPIQRESLVWHGEWENYRGDFIEYYVSTSRSPNASHGPLSGYGTYNPRP
jgi:hypothetical protein